MGTVEARRGDRLSVGIDVGGTHTDIVAVAADGRLELARKVPSNPLEPLQAIRDALATLPPARPIDLFVNGTTIGINAVLQRALPPVALVTTRGFRDLLYIRRETKANIYDLNWRKPRPLVPRNLSFEVDERIDADGTIVQPLSDLAPLLDWIDATDIDNIAVCLLHSYRNPEHEERVKQAISARRPSALITLSSEVWPEWREFERTYNTVLNAALKPVVGHYLDGLMQAVRESSGHDDVYIMHADGGILSPTEIRQRPVLTLLSGTVAGALLGARIAHSTGIDNSVSFDMGGTSTDISLSENGQPRRSSELSIEWEGTLGLAGVDVESIGAGGGSVAWADDASGLHVGPVSAGADPGPASYGRGGTRPTLTDAYVLLGYLGPEPVVGGRQLDAQLARIAFQELAEQTGLAAEELYLGVYRIATANLAAGIRHVTVERGVDPARCGLVCFGGAGPLHAAGLVRELGLASAVIPPRPGNGSAVGLLLAPVKHGVSQTYYAGLADLPTPGFSQLVEELSKRANAPLATTDGSVHEEWYCALRYRGQTRELMIPVETAWLQPLTPEAIANIAHRFHQKHEDEFTFRMESEPVELVTLRCEASLEARLDASLTLALGETGTAPSTDRITAYFADERGAPKQHDTSVVARFALRAGAVVHGPAVVLDVGSTILVPPGASGRADDAGNFVITWSSK